MSRALGPLVFCPQDGDFTVPGGATTSPPLLHRPKFMFKIGWLPRRLRKREKGKEEEARKLRHHNPVG